MFPWKHKGSDQGIKTQIIQRRQPNLWAKNYTHNVWKPFLRGGVGGRSKSKMVFMKIFKLHCRDN